MKRYGGGVERGGPFLERSPFNSNPSAKKEPGV